MYLHGPVFLFCRRWCPAGFWCPVWQWWHSHSCLHELLRSRGGPERPRRLQRHPLDPLAFDFYSISFTKNDMFFCTVLILFLSFILMKVLPIFIDLHLLSQGSGEMWCFSSNRTQNFLQTSLLSELVLNSLAAIFFC